MHSRFVAPALLALCLIVAGCETITDIGFPEHEPQLVVKGLFNSEGSWRVGLTRTIPITEDIGDFQSDLQNPRISIFRNGNLVVRLHPCGEHDALCGEGSPEPGATYTLRASADGFEEVRGSTFVPTAVPFSVTRLGYDDANEKHKLRISLDDPKGATYYMFYILQRGIAETGSDTFGTDRARFETNDPFLIRNNPDHGLILQTTPYFTTALFDDGALDGDSITFTVSARLFKNDCANCGGAPRTYSAVLKTISPSYYRYMRQYLRKTSSRIELPLQEGVAISGNIDGGLGAFAGASHEMLPIE